MSAAAPDHGEDLHTEDEVPDLLEIPEDAQQNAGIRFVKAERGDRPVTVEVIGIEQPFHRFGLVDKDLADGAPGVTRKMCVRRSLKASICHPLLVGIPWTV